MSYAPGGRDPMRPPGTSAQLESRRLRAWRLLPEGVAPVDVARRVWVDRRSVRARADPARASGGVAAGKKNVSGLNARLVFLDESGLLMAPLVRRTWAPRGQTPILLQRTRSHDKVSVTAVLTVSPRRRRVSLY